MIVEDFEQVEEVNDVDTLERKLSVRYANAANSFTLSHGRKREPVLLILVRGELANLHYFPRRRHPGFQSTGTVAGLDLEGSTIFFITNAAERQEVLNRSVVPVSLAVQAAKEFLVSEELPQSVQWEEMWVSPS